MCSYFEGNIILFFYQLTIFSFKKSNYHFRKNHTRMNFLFGSNINKYFDSIINNDIETFKKVYKKYST